MSFKIETPRLLLREFTRNDYEALCAILQDDEVMYAYEGAFSDAEAHEWLEKQLIRYDTYGFGLWAVELRSNGRVIGQCGLTWQSWNGETLLEVGYLFQKSFWHNGYATEAAQACRDHAFTKLGAEKVCSIIRETNTASQNVAKRNGMKITDSWTKHYRGVDMPHLLYSISRLEWEAFK